MSAIAVFTSRPNSHPFQDRRVSLHETVKVGRSVARARPAPNNAIFDCKVLSRNHAQLWYEDGRFLLQDTKSSNGTFINNQRLSKGSEESQHHEIFSGDVVQFGVDVMENSRRVTHSCIIALIQLYLPDGTEATNSHKNPFLSAPAVMHTSVQSQELYQLSQYLQEATHREQMLENKLATLQRLIQNTQEASESGWQALIDEDRLLSRIEVLENQLQVFSKNQTEDTLRQELVALQEDKYNYETTAKESLRRVLQEKLEAVRKLSDLVRSLSNMEDECSHLREMCKTSQQELQELATKHQEQITELAEEHTKLLEAESEHKEELEKAAKVHQELEEKLETKEKEEQALRAQIEALRADNDFSSEQLSNIKARMESLKEENGGVSITPEQETRGVQVDLVSLMDLKFLTSIEKDADESVEDDMSVGDSRNDDQQCKDKEGAQESVGHYKAQLDDAKELLKERNTKVDQLQKELEKVKTECVSHVEAICKLEEKILFTNAQHEENDGENVKVTPVKSIENILENDLSSEAPNDNTEVQTKTPEVTLNNSDIDAADSNITQANIANDSDTDSVTTVGSCSMAEVQQLQDLLDDAIQAQQNSESDIGTLKQQLKKLEAGKEEAEKQLNVVTEQLREAQQAVKQSSNETEQLRVRVGDLEKELDSERCRRTNDTVNSAQQETQKQTPRGKEEYEDREKECRQLQNRIHDIEMEMKQSCAKNNELAKDYHELQESYAKLEAVRDGLLVKLQTKKDSWQHNLTDAQKGSNQTTQQLEEATGEILRLTTDCCERERRKVELTAEMEELKQEFEMLTYKSRTLSTCSMIPLLLLLFAIMLAFNPFLSWLTVTTPPTHTHQ
ncbi:hypothetical protein LSAT2_026382 [Lamellibrachia satsuma]|nr:hypothetical protein LSAT2_026382 [Lamellibrachia satsuma]